MRFLLFTFVNVVTGGPSATAVKCGKDVTKADKSLGFVIKSACDSGETPTLHKADGSDGFDAFPAVTPSSVTKTAAGHFDATATANYQLPANIVVSVAEADKQFTIQPGGVADDTIAALEDVVKLGFGVMFQGEELTADVVTAMNAIGTAATWPSAVLCAKSSRGKFSTLSADDNIGLTGIDKNALKSRCENGVLATVADADFANHNTVGDGTKKCWHLPYEGAYSAVKACTKDTHTCDRFSGTGDQCITTTTIMSQYTKATPTVKHCMRWPTAAADDKYRATADGFSSQECTKDYYCNQFGGLNSDAMCIQHILGTDAKSQARVAGAEEGGGSTTLKWCLSTGVGAKQCAKTEVCNPHAAAYADLCIEKTGTAPLFDKVMPFGAVGADAPDTGEDKRQYCIGDNGAGAVCPKQTVCNYAGGTQSDGTAGGDICIAHTKLLGTLVDTAPWTAAGGRGVLEGDGKKFCLATDGTTYSSKVCLDTESCNPHASSPADVCIKSSTILAHAEDVPEAADPVADSKRVCIGKSFWKECDSAVGDVVYFCNHSAASVADVCLLKSDAADAEDVDAAFGRAGVLEAADQKWCVGMTDGAGKCGEDQVCNPSGEDGGTGSKAICVDNTKVVAHGEPSTDELTYCLGRTGNAESTEDELGFLCDGGKGQFLSKDAKMAPKTEVAERPDPEEEDYVHQEWCFGKDVAEKCAVGETCNSSGSIAGTGCGAACDVKNICIGPESLIKEGGEYEAGEDGAGKVICLNADATSAEKCTEEKMYCDQTAGTCSASSTDGGGDGDSTEAATDATSGCAASGIAAAAVVAILSA